MQIIHGGKLSRLQCLIEICGKIFAVLSFMQYRTMQIVHGGKLGVFCRLAIASAKVSNKS